ncbi:ABC transporter permease [uncultured Limosilactobacillus sp.]|uniref:ABC transporter permease n=1 Tax=uncultured Limosilactobacillus sp. TaxID=2837629 RepID=UPI0025E34B5D|nr:ABC transporter permease [uncultured Limosilactobacillus sp.]
MKKYEIEIPEAALKQLEIDNTEYSMRLEHNSILVRPANVVDLIPQIHFWWYGIFATLSAVAFLLYVMSQHYHVIPLSGNDSIATASILLSAICGTLAFAITFIVEKMRGSGPARSFSWRSLPPLIVASAMIIIFIMLAVYWLLGELFHGLRLDIYTSTVLIFIAEAVVNYLMINLAMTISPGVITNLMTIMIVGGVGFSMLTNSTKNWWRHNFSFLGTNQNSNHFSFNITLVFSGLLLMILIDYLFVNLNHKYRGWKVNTLRGLLYALGACIGCIGLFPNNPEFHILHDRIAMWLVYLLLILIVAVRWILPEVTKDFLKVSHIIGAVIAVDYIVFEAFTYLSLTAFELIAFMLAFAWILLLLQYIETLVNNNVQIFPVSIKVVPDRSE